MGGGDGDVFGGLELKIGGNVADRLANFSAVGVIF